MTKWNRTLGRIGLRSYGIANSVYALIDILTKLGIRSCFEKEGWEIDLYIDRQAQRLCEEEDEEG